MSNYAKNYKKFISLSLLPALLFLAGCVPSSVNMKPPVTSETPLNNDGVVVARVINAGGWMLPFNQLTITPKNINESKDNKYPRLTSLNDPDGTTSLFASAIPPGEYSVESVRSFFVIGDYFYSQWAPGGVDLGVFKVAPGKITDLGTFIYYRKVEGDKYSDRLIRVPQTNNQDMINQYRSFLKYSSADVLTWNEDGSDADRFSSYVSLSQNPTLFTERYISKNGSLFMLGKLGAVLERTVSGEWRQDALDTNADLNAIAQDAKGQLLVGGDQGALFFRGQDSKWQNLSLDVGTKIDSIQFIPTGEALIYTIQNGVGVILRGNPAKGKSAWKKHYSYVANKGWRDANEQALNTGEPEVKVVNNKQRIVSLRFETFLGRDYIRVATQQSGYDNEFNTLDQVDRKLFRIASDTQLTYEAEMAGKMDRITQAGNVSLGVKVAGFWSWTGKDGYFRYDSATNSWAEIKTSVNNCTGVIAKNAKCKVNGKVLSRTSGFNFISTPVFVTAEKGYASVRPSLLVNQNEPYMVVTDDGGKNWKKLSTEFPGKFCTDMVPEMTDRIMLYCAGVSGDFYESIDEGKTWKHVRQHQVF